MDDLRASQPSDWLSLVSEDNRSGAARAEWRITLRDEHGSGPGALEPILEEVICVAAVPLNVCRVSHAEPGDMARYAPAGALYSKRAGIFLVACPANCARVSPASHVGELQCLRPDSGDRYPSFCKEPAVLAARVRRAGHVLVSVCRDVVPGSARMVRGRPGELAG